MTERLSRRHHYVPQFYLRGFADTEGYIWQYRREASGRISERRVSPKRTAFANDLYTLQDAGRLWQRGIPDRIETEYFKELDNYAALVLKKIIRSNGVPLGGDERKVWALFLNSLLERSVHTLRQRDARAPAIAEQILAEHRAANPELVERALKNIDAVAMTQNEIREYMLREIRRPDVIDYFTGLEWEVIQLGPAARLITSDTPLVINGANPQSATPIRMMTLALTPSVLFAMYPKGWTFEESFKGSLVVSHILSLVNAGCEYVYSCGKIEDGQVVRLRRMVFEHWGRPTEPPDCTPAESTAKE